MRLKNIFSITLFLLLGFIIQGCSDSDKADATRLTVVRNNAEINQLSFSVGSGSAIIGIQSDGDWTAESSDTTWCKLAVHAGYGYADSLRNSYTKVSVTKNEGEARQTTITVKAGGLTKLITVSQKGTGTDPGDTFMSAFTFVDNMVIGYNLGNTLDSNPYGDWWNPEGKTPVEWETQWGQPETTQEIIDAIAAKGFNVIRVPVTWGPHMDANDNVDPAWMNRVEQVVKMVLQAKCYCILNVQHDSGDAANSWLRADLSKYPEISTRFKKLWQQIASHFKNYDDHLAFEAFNEILSASGEWGDPADASCYEAVNKLEQDFVDVVRATGGNNEFRNLLVNPYSSGSTDARLAGMQLPQDKHSNHLMCSIHSYDPYWFCNDSNDETAQQYYITVFNDDCKKEIDAIFARVHKRFSEDFGVPYFYGEFGAIGTHPAMNERIAYAKYMVSKFKAYNTTGLWWMGLIDRRSLNWYESEIVDALMNGIK